MICIYCRCESQFHCLCVCVCKQMLIWLFLAHRYMQMWPSDLHTCFACIIPTVAWHFHSCSYALDCTLWLHRIRQIFKPTHIHKYPPPSNTNRKLRQTHKTCTMPCSGRHFEGTLRSRLLFVTHRKHRNFYRSTVVCKQAHSFPVCLTRFLKQHTHTQTHMMIKRSEGLQGTLGLGTAVNHSYDVVHAFYSDLSGRFGDCPHWRVSRTRQGHRGLLGPSFLLLRRLGAALFLPWAKQWQVRLHCKACTPQGWETQQMSVRLSKKKKRKKSHKTFVKIWDRTF